MTTALILIGIYLVSIIGAYKLIQKSKGHKSSLDFITVFYPVINTGYVVLTIADYLGNQIEKKIDWNKFFNKF
jgi:hypothetical protein